MRRFITLLIGLSAGMSCLSISAIAAPAAPKEWTIIVYLDGNNSLDSYATVNLLQMEQVGSTAQMNIVVEWASLARNDTERLLIEKSTDPTQVTSPVVQDVGTPDMGDPNTLVDFTQWAITNYPAQHYLLDIWDHGSGWHPSSFLPAPGATLHGLDIGYDQNTGHWISTEQLGVAIGQIATTLGHPLDVYASDACEMEMAEIAGEMLGSVQVYAGSEEVEPGDGWSYADFLNLLVAKPDASPKDVGTFLEQSYVNAYGPSGIYADQGANATFAALDMSAFPAFESSMKAFTSSVAALSPADAATVLTAVGQSLAFTDNDYVDLSSFLTNLDSAGVASLGKNATAPLEATLQSLIIAAGGTGSAAKATGLSLWIPSSADAYQQYLSLYTQLKFDQATGWSAALKQLLASSSAQ